MDEQEQAPSSTPPAIDLESLKQLSFGPDWTRKPPQATFQAPTGRPPRSDRGDDRRFSRGGPRPPRSDYGQPRPPPRGDRDRPARPRPAFRDAPDRPASGFRRDDRPAPAPDARRDDRPAGGPAFRDAPDRPAYGYRRDDRRDEDPGEILPLHISFLPEQKVLSVIIHQIAVSRKAHPLMEVASLFFAHEDACDIRVEFQEAPAELQIYQCKTCRAISLDQESMARHALASHLEDFFEKQEVVVEAPAGNFTCVARCRLSGTLIGPPNHHSYPEALKELHASRFADMSFDEYSRRVEVIHDPALIEQWKEQTRKQILYKRKQAEGDAAKPVKRAEAEAWLMKNEIPSLILRGRRAILPRKVAAAVKDRSLRRSFIGAWRREKQFPASLMFALRGAFRNRRLFTFKNIRGATFVTAIEPSPLNATHVVEGIREILVYLREHPESKRLDLIQSLRPGLAPDSPDAAKLLAPLGWLIEKGHITEFSNGTLAVPGAGAPAPSADKPATEKPAAAAPEAVAPAAVAAAEVPEPPPAAEAPKDTPPPA